MPIQALISGLFSALPDQAPPDNSQRSVRRFPSHGETCNKGLRCRPLRAAPIWRPAGHWIAPRDHHSTTRSTLFIRYLVWSSLSWRPWVRCRDRHPVSRPRRAQMTPDADWQWRLAHRCWPSSGDRHQHPATARQSHSPCSCFTHARSCAALRGTRNVSSAGEPPPTSAALTGDYTALELPDIVQVAIGGIGPGARTIKIAPLAFPDRLPATWATLVFPSIYLDNHTRLHRRRRGAPQPAAFGPGG